jgi:hypothetical protein
MPIKGLTEVLRLPRLGKIHLGIKVQKAGGGPEYPQKTDYFVCPPEVQKVFGEKPKALRIMFPVEDTGLFAAQYYKAYSMGRGLLCKGDGVAANMLLDAKTDEMATKDSANAEFFEVVCDGKGCEYYGKVCTEVMTLQFLLPDVEGLGVWQIDTGSINSIRNINSSVALIKSIAGHIAGIPLQLVVEPLEVAPDGKKKTVYVLNIKTNIKLQNLADIPRFKIEAPKVAPESLKGAGVVIPLPDKATVIDINTGKPLEIKGASVHTEPQAPYEAPPPGPEDPDWVAMESAGKVELPETDKEIPERIIPENQEPPGKPAAAAPKLKTVGSLLTTCHKDWGLMRADTLAIIGVTDVKEIADLDEAYAKVKAHMEAQSGHK